MQSDELKLLQNIKQLREICRLKPSDALPEFNKFCKTNPMSDDVRLQLFMCVKSFSPVKGQRVSLLVTLTEDGSIISGIESELMSYLPQLLKECKSSNQSIHHFYSFLIRLIKRNAFCLASNRNDIVLYSKEICRQCLWNSKDHIDTFVNFCQTLLCNLYIPNEAWATIIPTICYIFSTNNSELLWNLINLFFNKGRYVLLMISKTIDSNIGVPNIVTNAIYFLARGVWNNSTLKFSNTNCSLVLNSLKIALRCPHVTVLTEIIHSISLFISHASYANDLFWQIMVGNILYQLLTIYHQNEDIEIPSEEFFEKVDALLNKFDSESKHRAREKFCSSISTLSITRASKDFVIRFMQYQRLYFINFNCSIAQWLQNLNLFFENYYLLSDKSYIQESVCCIINELLVKHGYILAERIIHIIAMITDQLKLQNLTPAGISALIDLICNAICSFPRVSEELLEKYLKNKFQIFTTFSDCSINYFNCLERILLVYLRNRKEAIIFEILQYFYKSKELTVFVNNDCVRKTVFDTLLNVRVQEDFQLYYSCTPGECVRFGGPVPQNENFIANLVEFFVNCIENETFYSVLHTVISKFNLVLQNRSMMLLAAKTRHPNAGSSDASLKAFFLEFKFLRVTHNLLYRSEMRKLNNCPPSFRFSSLKNLLYPSFETLMCYRASVEMAKSILKCLLDGLDSSTARICVPILTVCLLEIPSVCVKELPLIIQHIDRLKEITSLSFAVIEFLSVLSRLPKLHVNLRLTDLEKIFDWIIMYTNGAKFSDYCVWLAHLTLATWFVNTRARYRVELIGKLLKKLDRISYNIPKEETVIGYKNKYRRHLNMIEVFRNLVSQYALCPDKSEKSISLISAKKSLMSSIVSGGHQRSWFLGNRLISITVNSTNKFNSSSMTSSTLPASETKVRHKSMPSAKEDQTSRKSSNGRNRHSSSMVLSNSKRNLHGSSSVVSSPIMRQCSNATDTSEDSSSSIKMSDDYKCTCWLSGWAEIVVRHSTGVYSWLVRAAPSELERISIDAVASWLQKSQCCHSLSDVSSSGDLVDSQELSEYTTNRRASIAHKDQSKPRRHRRTNSFSDIYDAKKERESSIKPKEKSRHTTFINLQAIDSSEASTESSKPISAFSVIPSQILLQLCHNPSELLPKPIPLIDIEKAKNKLAFFDSTLPRETHKIGIVYLKDIDHSEQEILRNQIVSVRYTEFLSSIGQLVSIDELENDAYKCGLTTHDCGPFAYMWQDEISHVVFHVATIMPEREDLQQTFISKKRLIGNDAVVIVYNDSGCSLTEIVLKGHVGLVNIVIEPLDGGFNRVYMVYRDQMANICQNFSSKVVSDPNLAILVRQLALHTNLASLVHQADVYETRMYSPNWLTRLNILNDLREMSSKNGNGFEEDFINYAL